MGVALGGLVSLGGGSSGGGGSTSGIISINGQTGPAIFINGVNGISISAGGNVITVNGAALSGLITTSPSSGITEINSQTGPAIQFSGVNGIEVSEPRNDFVQIDYFPQSGIFEIAGQTGPIIGVLGMNGISAYGTGNLIVIDGFDALSGSGIQSIQGDSGPHITLDGANGLTVTSLGNGHILLDVASLSGQIGTTPPGSGITEINSEIGPAIQISGINGLVVTQPRPNFILLDVSAISGVSSNNNCYSTTFANVLEQTFTHGLGTKSIIVQIQDTADEFIGADAITAIDINNVTVRFNTFQSGRLTVLSCGGTALAASGVTKFAASFLGITSGIFAHGLNTRDVLVQVYDVSGPPRQILPDDVIIDTLDAVSLLFNVAQTGRVVIMG